MLEQGLRGGRRRLRLRLRLRRSDNSRELGLQPRMILHARVLPVAKRKSRRAPRRVFLSDLL